MWAGGKDETRVFYCLLTSESADLREADSSHLTLFLLAGKTGLATATAAQLDLIL